MSARDTVGLILKRLDNVIDALPKEGYKAAVAIGVVDSIRILVENLADLADKIECLAGSRGNCSQNGQQYCYPKCANLFLQKVDNTYIISKYKNNAFGARLSSDNVTINIRELTVVIDGSTIKVIYKNGGKSVDETINLSEVDEVYYKNYIIKYAARKTRRPVSASLIALRQCMIKNGVSC